MSTASPHLVEALSAYRHGEFERCLALLDALPPSVQQDLQALVLRINAAIQLDRLDETIATLSELAARLPDDPRWPRMQADALNRRGAQRREQGRTQAALTDLRAALALAPGHALADYNAALACEDLGDYAAARAHLERHLLQDPQDGLARLLWIDLLGNTGDAARAERELDALIEADAAPRGERLALSLARRERFAAAATELEQQPLQDLAIGTACVERLRQAGEPESTRRAARRVAALCADDGRSPWLRLEFAAHLHLDPVPMDRAAQSEQREAFAQGLDALASRWDDAALARLQPALEQAAWSNFYLAYQGEDDLALQSRFGDLLQRAVRHLSPGLEPGGSRRPGPPRVGFLGSIFRDCTAGNYFGAWVGLLRRSGFEVHLFQLGPSRDALTERLTADASRFHFHEGPLNELARSIAAADLDLLIYPELGMDLRLPPLAALRLARRQAVAFGHPVTSGLDSIDAYFSCSAMEPPGAAAHYRERLFTLPGLGVDYPQPMPAPTLEIGELPAGPRVLLPHSAFKLHPDTDAVVAAIAARCPDACFVLFEGGPPRWARRLRERLGRALDAAGADPTRQLRWLPMCDRRRFQQINRACDLMLDNLHWSGGNSSLDALANGLPLLTCRGRFMRGRQSAAMLETLGVAEELVASDADDLVQRALGLLAAPEARRALRTRIETGLPQLFDAGQARAAFVAAVAHLCREAGAAAP